MNWIKKLFKKNNQEEIDEIILYYRKRLYDEMKQRQDREKYLFEKIYRYRDKLIENGLYEDMD